MKRNLLLWLLLLCSGSAWAQTTLRKESFESNNGEGVRYTSNSATVGLTTTKYFFRASDPVAVNGTQTFGLSGGVQMTSEDSTYFWACEGVRGASQGTANPTVAGVITLSGINNTQSYTNLQVTVAFGEPRNGGTNVQSTDHLRIQYAYGSATGTFATVGEFARDPNLPSGTSPWTRIGGSSPTGTTSLTSTFSDHVFSIPSGAGALYIRIEADYFGSNKEIAFDNIRVTGTASAVPKPTIVSTVGTNTLTFAEGSAPLTVFSGLTVGNPAMATNPTLSEASVTITPYAGTEDALTYIIPAGSGIAAPVVSTSGTSRTLTFAGTSSLSNYEALLESVKYQDTDGNNATAGNRLFSFVVKAGTVASIPLERTITVTTALNPAGPPIPETFDTDGEGTRYASNTRMANSQGFLRLTNASGGSATPGSSFTNGNTTFTNVQGNGYWYANGTNGVLPIGTPGRLTLAPVNSTGFRNLRFKIKAGASSSAGFGTDDYLRFSYSTDGGTSFTIFASFSGASSSSPLYLNGNAANQPLTTALTDLDFALTSIPADATIVFRVEANNGGGEQIVFDNIQITGTQSPTVSTAAATTIGSVSAVLGGNVTADGGDAVTDRGVVYVAGTGTPTTGNTKVQIGSGTGSFSQNITGLTASTQYTVRAYAINSVGTAYGSSQTFTTRAPVSGSTVVTNVACFGGSNGAINLTPTGGTGSGYTFNWGGGITTEDRTGLAAGTYSVTITDGAGATGTVNGIVVTQPTSAVGGSTVVTNVSCNGGSNGAINLTPTGGTGSGYTFLWNNGTTTEDRTGLAAGTYSVTITDSNGCTGTVSNIIVTQPASALATTGTQTDVTTNGGNNGSATVTVSGGTSPYTYSWSPNVSTSATASNLSAGTYTVTVTDANGCTTQRTFTITQPTAATVVSVTRLNPSPTATAQVRYQVLFSSNVTGVNMSNFTVTQSGVTGASISSATGADATYTVTVNTGTGNGTLRLNVNNTSNNISPTITNVPYTAGEEYTITKSFAAAPQLTIQGTGGSGGDVTAFVDVVQVLSGGTAVANALQNSSFETHASLSNGDFGYNPAGASWTFNSQSGIAEGGSAFSPPTPIPNGIAVGLVQGLGQIQQNLAVPTGNNYRVSFQASQRNCCNSAFNQTLNVFLNGVFLGSIQPANNNAYIPFTSDAFSVTVPALTATVTSTAGASGTSTSTSPIPYTVTFSASVTGFTSAGVAVTNGTLSGFTGSGTTYTFNVTPTATGAVTVNVPANAAFDANNTGNATSNTYTLTATTLATVTTAAANTIGSASAVLGGSVTADGGGAVTARGVVYSVNSTNGTPAIGGTGVTTAANGTGTGSFSQNITGLTANTTYAVRAYATNSTGTGYGAVVTFTTRPPVGGTTVVTNVSCFGGSNGAINLTPTGGTGSGYTFNWGGGITTEDRTGLAAGTYSVTITDGAGATGTVNGIVVTQPTSAVGGSTVVTNVSCNGGSNGTINLTPTGGTGSGYTFLWNNGTTTEDRTGLAAGIYSVTITDSNGCTGTVSNIAVTQPPVLATTGTQTDVTTNGGNNGSATVTPSGGTSPYAYSWSPNVSTSATASNLSAGTYTVTVTDANGCTTQRTFTITQPAAPSIAVAPATLASGTVGTAYNQAITASGGTAPYTYAITAGTLPTGLTLTAAGVLSGTPTAGGSFTFTVRATDASAAPGPYSGSLSYTLTIAAPTIVVAPATLPNGTQGTAYSQTFTASGGTAPYTYAVTTGALPAGLSLNAGILAGTPTVSGSFNFTVTATDNSTGQGAPYSGSQSYTLVIAAPTQTTWTGNVSTDWFTAGNWTAGVPTATVDASIPTAPSGNRFPAITTAGSTGSTRNLTFNSGATLTHTNGTLDVRGNLTNNGTYQPTGGTTILGATTLTSILGSGNTRFWNLTIGANGAQSSTSASTSVQGLFTLNGNFTTNGNPLTLESNATATALVVNNGSSAVVGTATVQRYIDPSLNPGLGYRHYSSPVTSTTVADLTTSTFTPVVNPAYNSVGNTVTPFPTVYGYDESRLNGTNATTQGFDQGFFSPNALTDQLVRGRGYAVNLDAASKVDLVGTLNTGTVAVGALSLGTEANSGWHLLGNPYPAPLNWNVARANLPTGMIDAVYVFKSSSQYAGTYQFYQNGFGTLPSGLIGAMQGFFVRVSQPVVAFSFLNTWRQATYANPTFNRTTADTRPAVQLELVSALGARDAAFVYFEQGATAGMDDHYDAAKLPNTTGLNLASLVGSTQAAVNGLPTGSATTVTVPLFVGLPATGTYTLHAEQVLNFTAGAQPFLRDRQLGTLTDLSVTPDYTFTMNAANTTPRFELVFGPQSVLSTASAALAAQVSVFPNPATKAVFVELPASLRRVAVTAALVDALGRVVLQQQLPAGLTTHTLPLTDVATGVYSLRLQTSAGVVVKKLVVE